MKVLSWASVILLLLFPLGEIGRVQLQNNISFTINDIVIAVVGALWLVLLVTKQISFPKTPFSRSILIFVGIAFISLLVNAWRFQQTELVVSFLYLIRFVMYISLFFVVRSLSSRYLIKSLTLAGVGTIVIGFLQYFFYPSLRNLYYLGWDEHLYRLFGSFLDPNFAATILCVFFLFFSMQYFLHIQPKSKLFFLFCLVFSGIGVFLTYSRSGMLMLIVSCCIMLFLLGKKKHVLSVFGVLLFAVILMQNSFRSEGTNLFRLASGEARFASMQDALKIVRDNPILGVGFNAYRFVQQQYGFVNENPKFPDHGASSTDNSFLFVLATTGVVGLAAYIWLLTCVLLSGWKIYTDKSLSMIQKYHGVFLLSLLGGLFVNALFINSLFYPFVMELLWISVAVTERS